MYYVYAICDKSLDKGYSYGPWFFQYEPFYIGKGSGNRCYNYMAFRNNEVYKRFRSLFGFRKLWLPKYCSHKVDTIILINNIKDSNTALKLESQVIQTLFSIENNGLLNKCNLFKGSKYNNTLGRFYRRF